MEIAIKKTLKIGIWKTTSIFIAPSTKHLRLGTTLVEDKVAAELNVHRVQHYVVKQEPAARHDHLHVLKFFYCRVVRSSIYNIFSILSEETQ